ncbi:SDR family NAD(P)-dependent oxidoreductase [Streptomyces cellostaticus]|uniref:SDR family NAD(P)-dependent oxidoreductase n=1 Tax=Streptomyces cellostaticus TaxID=67285 RepID=UPI0020268E7F|nr:SDR family NAD(P)-dependent oxidoreductase [Streptomyces cellostaticus]
MSWSTNDIPDLSGKTAVVTGANGGLGLASAKALAGKGAQVVMAVRNQTKAMGAREEILAAHPDAALELVALDLASQASVRTAAEEILTGHDRLDILMCNAGVMALPHGPTEDGFDTQLGINVLGHWALVSHLLPLIVSTPGARVVTLSSLAQHQGRPLDTADPHMHKDFDTWAMYGATKLAMRHLAVGLQQQFDAAGLDAKALSAQPGSTDSDLQIGHTAHSSGGRLGRLAAFMGRHGMSPDRGALSQLRAATDPRAPGGGFYGPRWAVAGPPVRRPLLRPGSDAAIRTLWQVGRTQTGLPIDVTNTITHS